MEECDVIQDPVSSDTINYNTTPDLLSYNIRNCLYLTDRLYQMKNSNLLSDLVFEIHDHRIHAHRCVVAAWSPFLYNQLKLDLACMEIVRVHYDNYEIFADMISFMYTGKIDLRDTNLIQLLHLATSFQIDALRSVCEETLRCNLHEGNIVSTFYVAQKFKLDRLEEYALSYLQMNLPEAVKQADFLNLSAVRFNTFLSTGCMVNLKPEVKLFLIISWLGYDVKEREQFLVPLLQHIDWTTVAGDFLLEISQTENFFTTNESSLFLLLQTLHSSKLDLGSYKEVFPLLREKYSYLLAKVVQNSVLTATPEQYYPITINVTIALVQANDNFITQSNVLMNSTNYPENNCNTVGLDTVESVLETDNGTITQVVAAPNLSPDDTSNQQELLLPDTGRVTRTKTQKDRTQNNSDDISSQPLIDSNYQDGDDDGGDDDDNGGDGDDVEYEAYEEEDDTDDVVAIAFTDDTETSKEDDFVSRKPHRASKQKPVEKKKSSRNLKTFQCNECEYTTVNEVRYDEHRQKVHNAHKQYSCHICDFSCNWNKKFSVHMKTHYYGPPYQCEHEGCPYTSDRIRNILIHRVCHTGERPFPCDQCDMRFRTRSNLYAHKKCHQGEKPWKCTVCDLCFATKSTLNQHSVRHSDDRPYLCDKCGFGTKFQSHLISHKRIHTGDLFHCQFPQCEYSAPRKNMLKSHMRSHLGVRKFSCEHCQKTFVEKSHLTRHKRIHLEVKPFSCSKCSYSSARRDKLKEHMLKRHETCKPDKTTDKKSTKKPKVSKKGKRGVKLEPQELAVCSSTKPVAVVCEPVICEEQILPQQPVNQPDPQMYPQMPTNAPYLTPLEPVILEQTPQNMILHNTGTNLYNDGQMLTSNILHPQYPTIDPQQVAVVMDARIHTHLHPRSIIVDPNGCINSAGTIQNINNEPSTGNHGIVYAVPTTSTPTVVVSNPHHTDYSALSSYYSYVMKNEDS